MALLLPEVGVGMGWHVLFTRVFSARSVPRDTRGHGTCTKIHEGVVRLIHVYPTSWGPYQSTATSVVELQECLCFHTLFTLMVDMTFVRRSKLFILDIADSLLFCIRYHWHGFQVDPLDGLKNKQNTFYHGALEATLDIKVGVTKRYT